MSPSELCIRRPVMTILLTAAILIFGAMAYGRLPVAALPRVEYPTIVVTASLPGASPETMATAVATPLEKQFSTIAGVESITSQNGRGTASITLQFALDRAIDAAALDVQSAISVAVRRLPSEMTTPPSFRKVNPADSPVLLLAMTSPTQPLSAVNDLADNLVAPRLATLSGVAQVLVFGEQKYAVRVSADPRALTARDLVLDDLVQAIATVNANTPTGYLNTQSKMITLEATGALASAAGFRDLVVAWRKGAPVRLSEVAAVADGVENERLASWYNGVRSIVLAVYRQPDANTVKVAADVQSEIAGLKAQLPPSVGIEVLLDRSVAVRDSVRDVQITLGLSAAMVVVVIFLFLRSLSATFIPVVVLPVSIVGTFGVMYLLDFSIDNLSLMALTLAVGFVVDDAIVVLENVVRHLHMGKTPFQAALDGAREIGFTIVSITLSLIAAFIPLLFMGGVIGRMFHEFAVTISVAVLISGLVSLTLTPMMCARLLEAGDDRGQGGILGFLEKAWDGMLAGYRVTLEWVLAHRFATLMATFATVVLTGVGFSAVPKGFFPLEDTGIVSVITEGAEDISFDAMVERHKAVADIVLADPAVAGANYTVGQGGPNKAMNTARLLVMLKPMAERGLTTQQVIQRLRAKCAQVTGISAYFQPVQNLTFAGPPTKNLYQYTIQAADLDELFQWARTLEARLKELPVLQDISSDLQIGTPVTLVDLDLDKAAAHGITAENLRSVLYSAFGNRRVATIYTPVGDYPVILEVDRDHQSGVADLSRLHLRSASGKLVPLDEVAVLRRTVGPSTVNHKGQRPSVTLSFNLPQGGSLGTALEHIHGAERELGMPPSVVTGFQGQAEVFRKSLANQGWLIAAALVVVYIVLGVLYESFIHPLTIVSGLPSAALGALLTLIAFRTELSVISIIGIVMLIGIVKKNGIMMVDFAIERRRQGQAPLDAIREACLLRFRPIMMTTFAAIVGALPLALGLGAGGELRRPLGLAVVGGMVVSQVLTLYITPVIYLYLERLNAAAEDADAPRRSAEQRLPGAGHS